jgi:hypothetical protein
MSQICNCPFGFEDGHIIAYAARGEKVIVEYEFWNEQLGVLQFHGFVGLHDYGAINVTIGSTMINDTSELIDSVAHRLFESPPASYPWKLFQFLDIDETPVLAIVAESCTFISRYQSEAAPK